MFFSQSPDDPFPPRRSSKYCINLYNTIRGHRLQRAPGCLGAGGDPGGIGGILEEPHVGYRAAASRDRRERLGSGRDRGEIQIAYETLFAGAGIPHRVYTNIYGNNPLTDIFILMSPSTPAATIRMPA